MIGCCSINYKGVKNILFKKWFRVDHSSEDIDLHYIRTIIKDEEYRDKNKYLKILGNLPRYMNINNLLNKKLVNVIIKKIKSKVINFYNKRELLSL